MKTSEIQAFILAGGLGTRLRSVIADIPKPMAPIGDRPFLEYQIRYLQRQGIRRVVLLVGYKAEVIESYFGDGSRWGVSIAYCREKDLLGTAGALKNAESFILGDSLILLNGDTFFPCDLQTLLACHETGDREVTIALKLRDETSRYGSVIIDEEGRVLRFAEKAASTGEGYINGGIYVLDRRLLDRVAAGKKTSLETDIFPGASAVGVPMPDRFIDIGVPEDYERATTAIPAWESAQPRRAVFLDRDGVINEDGVYPHLPEHIRFMDGIFDFCRRAESKGYLLLVVTNQAGVGKGKYPQTAVHDLHAWMRQQFADRGITISDFAYCPCHEKAVIGEFRRASLYRKPEPGMVLDLAERWNVDLAQSFMLGDKESDRIRLPYLRSYIISGKYVTEGCDFTSLAQVAAALL